MDWLIAWSADLARVNAGGSARQNPDAAEALERLAQRVAPVAAVSLSSATPRAARAAGASAAAASRRRGAVDRLQGAVLTMAENKPLGPAGNPAIAAAGARPGVLSLNIRERAALYAAYMPFLKGGGIFIPTSRQYQLGEEVFMLLSLMDDPNRIAVQGKVVWITPEGRPGKPHAGHRRAVHAGRHRRHGARDHRADPRRDARFDPPDAHDVAIRRSAPRRPAGASAGGSLRLGHALASSPTDVRRLALPSRFSRARRRAAFAARRHGGGARHARAVHLGEPSRLARRARACHGVTRISTRPSAFIRIIPDTPEPSIDDLVERAARPKVVAIGETGLDYYRATGDLEWQRERFRTHIRAARRTGKPLVIHTRASAADTLAIMREEGAGDAGGVMHCFTETWDVARAALDMGFHISMSGIVTFRERAGPEGRRAPRPARPAADRNGFAVSRAGAVSRQAQPARLRRARRRGNRAAARRSAGDDRGGDQREFLQAVPHRRGDRTRCALTSSPRDRRNGCDGRRRPVAV